MRENYFFLFPEETPRRSGSSGSKRRSYYPGHVSDISSEELSSSESEEEEEEEDEEDSDKQSDIFEESSSRCGVWTVGEGRGGREVQTGAVRPICHCSVYNSATEMGARDVVSTGLSISNTQ